MNTLPTTGNTKLDEALKAIPDYEQAALLRWLESIEIRATRDDNDTYRVHQGTVRELEQNIQRFAFIALDVDVYGQEFDDRCRRQYRVILAKLMWAKDVQHRMDFYRALTHPDFAYVHSGHPVLPDSYGIYHSDKTSPTGVHRVTGGSIKDPRYGELIRLAGKRTCASRALG